MRVTIFKTVGERRIEGATWGLLLVWVGVMLSWDEPKGVAPLGAGALLLVSALLQKALGYEAGIVMWVAGLALTFSGLDDVAGETWNMSLLGAILAVVGVLIVIRSLGARRGHHLRDVSHRRPPDIDL